MEYGLEYNMFYVWKHIAALVICSSPPVVRNKPLGAPAFVRLAYWTHRKSQLRNSNEKLFCQENAFSKCRLQNVGISFRIEQNGHQTTSLTLGQVSILMTSEFPAQWACNVKNVFMPRPVHAEPYFDVIVFPHLK